MKKANILITLFAVLLGGSFLLGQLNFPLPSGTTYSPGLFASATGFGIIGCTSTEVIKADGSGCVANGGGSMIYPGAGVANSTGSAWSTSYQVGTSANDLVQLNTSGFLPALNASLLTNISASQVSGNFPISQVGSTGLSASAPLSIASTGAMALSSGGITATYLAPQYSKGQCTEIWSGSGTSSALQSGDDSVSNNGCFNDSGSTRTITAVKCRSDAAGNTTTVNPSLGSAGSGTSILSAALTCGSSYAYSSSGTVSSSSWASGNGIDANMGGTLSGTSIALLIDYTF